MAAEGSSVIPTEPDPLLLEWNLVPFSFRIQSEHLQRLTVFDAWIMGFLDEPRLSLDREV